MLSRVHVRQSDLKTWAKCPLMYRYQTIDQLPRLQSGSLTFGSILHECIMWMEINRDVETAVARFEHYWTDPTRLDPEYRIDYYVRGTNWRKYAEDGPRIIRNWWQVTQWDTALVLAREFTFSVPVGSQGHYLDGTVDKLEIAYSGKHDSWVVKIVDLKSNKKAPTYDYLEEDLQFSAYCYATTLLTFWEQLGQHLGWPPERAAEVYAKYRDLPRRGEWVQLTGPKRMDAGERTERHYGRLAMAVDALADSVAMRIFVPNISGESCCYCDYRKTCGLPEREED